MKPYREKSTLDRLVVVIKAYNHNNMIIIKVMQVNMLSQVMMYCTDGKNLGSSTWFPRCNLLAM